MASSLALKRLVSSTILPRSLRSLTRPAAAAPPSRFLNTNAVHDSDDDDVSYDRDLVLDLHRPSAPRRRDDCFADLFHQYLFFTRRGLRFSLKETEEALHLRVYMAGLGKEGVKVFVEQNSLIIKGEGAEEESENTYSIRFVLLETILKTDQIKVETKNGVSKVVVPKLEEERTDNFYVKLNWVLLALLAFSQFWSE